MTTRFTYFTVAIAPAISLVACETASLPQRGTLAQNTAPDVRMDVVRTPDYFLLSDDGGFGADVRHFGNTTPWSENPFFHPCSPN
jgi:hypothetical protein